MTKRNVLKRYLEKENMSQAEFARRLGVTPAAVNFYVSSKRQPRLPIARRMAKLTGLPLLDLIFLDIRNHR